MSRKLLELHRAQISQRRRKSLAIVPKLNALKPKTEGGSDYANIYQHSFAFGTSTRLTDFTSGYPRRLAISPDGANVLYEYQATGEWYDLYLDLDLWMMDRNGNGQTLFVQDARAPAWSLQMVPPPVIMDKKVFLPFVRR